LPCLAGPPDGSRLALRHSSYPRKEGDGQHTTSSRRPCVRQSFVELCSPIDAPFLDRNTTEVRPLRSTGITPLPHYYEPLRLPAAAVLWVMNSPQALSSSTSTKTPRRASQVPRPFCHCAPSPFTPRSPIAAHVGSFTIGTGFTFFGRLATPNGVTRPIPGSLALRLTASPPEASTAPSRIQPLVRLQGYRQLPRQPPFRLLERPGLTWRTEGHEGHKGRSLVTSSCPSCSSRLEQRVRMPTFARDNDSCLGVEPMDQSPALGLQ